MALLGGKGKDDIRSIISDLNALVDHIRLSLASKSDYYSALALSMLTENNASKEFVTTNFKIFGGEHAKIVKVMQMSDFTSVDLLLPVGHEIIPLCLEVNLNDSISQVSEQATLVVRNKTALKSSLKIDLDTRIFCFDPVIYQHKAETRYSGLVFQPAFVRSIQCLNENFILADIGVGFVLDNLTVSIGMKIDSALTNGLSMPLTNPLIP